MSVCRYNPVLHVGCGNPYHGLYRALVRFGHEGDYVGIDTRVDKEAVAMYANDIIIQAIKDPAGRWPFPPSQRHPVKEYAVAFCLGPQMAPATPEHVIMEMRRIATCVVSIGQMEFRQYRQLDFQHVGHEDLGIGHVTWGVWMNEWAETTKRRMDIVMPTATGYFMEDNRVKERTLFACQHCGHVDYSGAEKFKCDSCGKDNI